jgi:hypothetical protein
MNDFMKDVYRAMIKLPHFEDITCDLVVKYHTHSIIHKIKRVNGNSCEECIFHSYSRKMIKWINNNE